MMTSVLFVILNVTLTSSIRDEWWYIQLNFAFLRLKVWSRNVIGNQYRVRPSVWSLLLFLKILTYTICFCLAPFGILAEWLGDWLTECIVLTADRANFIMFKAQCLCWLSTVVDDDDGVILARGFSQSCFCFHCSNDLELELEFVLFTFSSN